MRRTPGARGPDRGPDGAYVSVDPPDLEPMGHQILQDAAQQARLLLPDERVTTSLVRGPCAQVLGEVAEDAQLLVLGCESRSTLGRLVTGSIVASLASRVSCPVVAVPVGWVPRESQPGVVVGIKSTEDSADLLLRAFRMAADRQARMVVLHAWKLSYGYDDVISSRADEQEWAGRAHRLIGRVVAGLSYAYADVSVEVRVVHGPAATVLQSASREADLLLLARRGHAFPLGHLGGVGRALLRESLCPVEIVPAAGERSDATGMVIERAGAMQR